MVGFIMGQFVLGIIATIIVVSVVSNKYKKGLTQEQMNSIQSFHQALGDSSAKQQAGNKKELPLMIMGSIFTVASLAVIYFLGVDTNFTCSRITNLCSIQTVNILGEKKQVKQFYVQELKSVRNEEASSGRNTRPYNVILETSSGDVRLLGAYKLSSVESGIIANEINTFINSQQQTIEINDSGSSTKNLGLFYLIIGVLMLFASKKKKPINYV
ncbi:MAG: hypothetical protein WCG95_07880 [bacterium]